MASIALAAFGLAVLFLVTRGSAAQATASVDGRSVAVVCQTATRVAATECSGWAEELLAAGAPSSTFDMEDLVRLKLDRPWWGLSFECHSAYFISRYPDDPVWEVAVPCPGTEP